MSWSSFVVCPECHNGFAQQIGKLIVCPEGHRFRLVKIKARIKRGVKKKNAQKKDDC